MHIYHCMDSVTRHRVSLTDEDKLYFMKKHVVTANFQNSQPTEDEVG